MPSVEHLPGIHEERHVEAAEYLPTVFAVEHSGIIIVKPESAISAQIARAAEHGLKIKRHAIAVVRLGSENASTQCDHAAVEERNVLLRLKVQFVE